ncbi:hypothetical protein [Chamaesiphon sp. OTE_20_metabat_361]|uniref:hypothetical protein n=1 Tax=Chamaesiphon sp. OTE_20_metabat_361 TaxID=2964689 RepID=UPI002869F4DD|nr:hypothetical protein [Chamaesiphon sp. OTE_20_metabat_361]
MTFTSIASKPTDRVVREPQDIQPIQLSKISVAASLVTILGLTFLPLLWMSPSYPAEIHPSHKQVSPAATVTSAQ